MKSHFIIDLVDGQAVTSPFLVREKEIRTSVRTGKSWLELNLADRTGTIPAKMWDNFAALAAMFECHDVIQVCGRVKLYNGQKEMTLEQIIPVAERDYDLGDYLPHTPYDIEKLWAELQAAIGEMKNPWLQRLLSSVVDDPAIAPRLKRAPAAMIMHHAYIGGLLEHVVSLVGLAHAVSAHYPELDADLLLAGVVLHDVGKIDELRYTRGIDYSDRGRLLGHITIGVGMVHDKIKTIEGFPASLAVLVEHLILSHHGSHEFGSPALPQIPEAIVLNFIDDVDSKMASMRATLAPESGGAAPELWTSRNPALRRSLLRAKMFLEDGAAAKTNDAPSANSAESGRKGGLFE
jgi:3'-5' exoribonuclease